MKRRLSTSMTFFWKYIFSFAWITAFTIGTIGAILSMGVEGLVFLMGLIFGLAILYYVCLRAKVVHIDQSYLYISNFKEEIKVPLSNVKSVYDKVMISPRPIFVEFSKETIFGNK